MMGIILMTRETYFFHEIFWKQFQEIYKYFETLMLMGSHGLTLLDTADIKYSLRKRPAYAKGTVSVEL